MRPVPAAKIITEGSNKMIYQYETSSLNSQTLLQEGYVVLFSKQDAQWAYTRALWQGQCQLREEGPENDWQLRDEEDDVYMCRWA